MRLGIGVGQWGSYLAPILGLLVFWLFPFKPAVTLYAIVVGLALVLRPLLEQARLSLEIEQTIRRHLHDDHAR